MKKVLLTLVIGITSIMGYSQDVTVAKKPLFPEKLIFTTSPNVFTPTSCEQGRNDAREYYRNGNAAARGTFFVTLLTGGLLGLIPAIITSSHTPKDRNLDYPDASLMQNPDYSRCYIRKAKSKKSAKIWTCWGIGVAVNVAIALLLLSGSSNGN